MTAYEQVPCAVCGELFWRPPGGLRKTCSEECRLACIGQSTARRWAALREAEKAAKEAE